MEEYAYIIDHIPPGSALSKKDCVTFAIGDEEFKLFELVPKTGAVITIGDRVFIGKDSATVKRDVIDHVKRRVSYGDLNKNAAAELEYAVNDIVMANQERFIKFFNNAEGISTRKHLLEELPGLGKKSMAIILEERKKGDFKDFADLSERTKVKAPEKLIVARIMLEIQDPDRKRYLFVSR